MMKKNNRPLQVGITGGIGSGKSTVCRIFTTLGIPVYEADIRAKWLMTHHQEIITEIKEVFGEDAYLENNQLNRAYLAAQVFNVGEKIKLLNAIVHPRVGEDYHDWIHQRAAAPYLLNEAALMFESGRNQTLDKVITVFAPVSIRLERVLKRDPQRNRHEVEAIMHKQIAEEEKMAKSDYIIYNDDTQLVIPQVLQLHQTFLRNST